jgi:hypothetical protein
LDSSNRPIPSFNKKIKKNNFQVMQHKMLELEISFKIGPKTGLHIENKGFQFPRVLVDINFL